MMSEKISQAFFPMVAGIKYVHQVGKRGKGVVQAFSIGPVEIGQQRKGAVLRQLPCYGKLTIPETGMVSTDISDNTQIVNE